MRQAVAAWSLALVTISCSHSRLLLGLKDCGTRAESAKILAAAKDQQDLPPLINALNPGYGGIDCTETSDPTPAVAAAVATYGQAAIDPLMKALQNPALRGGAAMALADIGDKRAVDSLMTVVQLGLTSGFQVDPAVYTALGALGDDRAVPLLLQAATSRVGYVDEDASKGLARLKSSRVPLVQMLKSARPDERANAVAILGWSVDPDAGDLVVSRLDDSDSSVREAALQALSRLARSAPGPWFAKALPRLRPMAAAETTEHRSPVASQIIGIIEKSGPR